ncbi:MAG: dehypoxanthine futalosine cyclase [Candidatus Brocadiae bacterium]|nr:dehypoxanthine futalosine cyclase [Candidatus Brocadiia bacterium]
MTVDTILARARDGARLSPEDALTLYREGEFIRLGAAAHAARARRTDPGTVTYLVDRNINYTNVCITDCLFCAFYRPPGHPEAYVLSRGELAVKMDELRAEGGTRVLLQGGHHPDLRLSWYEDLLRWMRDRWPDIEADAFSPSEVTHFAAVEGIPVADVLRRLADAGLAGLPGGGAEILDDDVRDEISPKKLRTAGWLEAMRLAHALGLATTASMVIGFGETWEQRVRHLQRLRDLQDESIARHGRGFTAFVSWTAQLDTVPMSGLVRRKGLRPAGAQEYLRNIAVARLFLDNFDHHGASWPTQGVAIAQVALHAGCDDYGSTMMEENVVSQAGNATLCAILSEEMQIQIREAGFVPAQRDTRYNILRRFEGVPAV